MILLSLILIPLFSSLASWQVKKDVRFLGWIIVTSSVLELVLATAAIVEVLTKGVYAEGIYFSLDALGALLLMIVAVIGLVAGLYSVGYLQMERAKGILGFRRIRQYFTLLHLFMLAMFFAVITTNPVLTWVAIEATTLSTAFLISFYNKPSAMEAAWKYLMINSIGLLLAFFGTLLILSINSTDSTRFVDWHTLLMNASSINPAIAKIAFIFILIGYGTKMGLAPMHTWLPDAHSKAPVPISSLLSGVLLNVAFLAILRFKLIIDTAIGTQFSSSLLIFFGILSVLIAAFMMLGQKNYKRMLAYSSIEHMGVMALGFGFGGVGIFAALLHMLYHSLAKSVLFLSSGNIFLKYSSTKIANVKGIFSVLPVSGILFLFGFLAATGVPPFGIFITEFYILFAGIASHPIAAVFLLLALALVFVGFFRNVAAMVFGEAPSKIKKGEAGRWSTWLPSILVIILIGIGFYLPHFIRTLIDSAAKSYL